MDEIWKDIKGYEGLYQVSNLGRVKSLSRMRCYGAAGYLMMPEKMLKEHPNKKGYLQVLLTDKEKNHKKFSIHRLVALHFIPNPDNLPQVNHKDEDKTNNRVDNLEWMSLRDNVRYGTGIQRRSITLRTVNAKCPVYQYDMEGNLVGEYISAREAARQTGFFSTAITNCCNNKVGFRTHKGYRWSYEKEDKPTRSAVG